MIAAYRDFLVERGIGSVHLTETRPERIAGCLEGFDLCRGLLTLAQYDRAIDGRMAREDEMRASSAADAYWRHRCATAQLEFVRDRLRAAYAAAGLYLGPLSASAALDFARWAARALI